MGWNRRKCRPARGDKRKLSFSRLISSSADVLWGRSLSENPTWNGGWMQVSSAAAAAVPGPKTLWTMERRIKSWTAGCALCEIFEFEFFFQTLAIFKAALPASQPGFKKDLLFFFFFKSGPQDVMHWTAADSGAQRGWQKAVSRKNRASKKFFASAIGFGSWVRSKSVK